MARGVKQLMGEVAVSGKEQKPRCVEVEPPHGKEPGMKIGWNKLGHTGPPLRVAHGGEIACGFMEHEVDGAFGKLDHVPVNGDYIAIDVNFSAKLASHRAIYRNTASGHKVFGAAAARHAGACEEPLEAHRRGVLAMLGCDLMLISHRSRPLRCLR